MVRPRTRVVEIADAKPGYRAISTTFRSFPIAPTRLQRATIVGPCASAQALGACRVSRRRSLSSNSRSPGCRPGRAKVAIRDVLGRVIGLVSVGVLERALSAEFRDSLPVGLLPLFVALVLGVAGAYLLARRVKRQTFGLEPDEIAALLEQREAMLHGVREGAITIDTSGRITLINDEAQRLLELDGRSVGGLLSDVVPAGRVRDVLTGAIH